MKKQNESEIMAASLGKEIEINGETVIVKPYTWVQTIKMAKPISVIVKTLIDNLDDLNKILGGFKESTTAKQIASVAEFVGNIPDADELINALTEMIAFSTGKDTVYIQSLMIDDVINLGTAVYEVNKTFFTKRLAQKKMPGQTKQGK